MLVGVLGQCSSLAMLGLGGNNIGAEGVQSLARVLGQCPSLAMLDLENNGLGPEGVRCLAQVLGQCSSLSTLDLAYNGCGHDGARGLAQVLRQCTSLSSLHLEGNGFYESGHITVCVAAMEEFDASVPHTLRVTGYNTGVPGVNDSDNSDGEFAYDIFRGHVEAW